MKTRAAIITGGLTGIGLACAKVLAKQGHKVAVGSRRGSGDESAAAARKLLGPETLIGELDVGDQKSVDEFVTLANETMGPPLILVNAAGIFREARIHEMPDEVWHDQVNINLHGPMRMIRAVMPAMREANWGRIVNISSTAGSKGADGYSGYCASKAGVIGLSRAVSQEGAPYNITCVSISPTWVETPMMDNALRRHSRKSGSGIAEARKALEKSNPQGRLVQPDEIAAMTAFCCSDECPALTNVDIQVNAGADW